MPVDANDAALAVDFPPANWSGAARQRAAARASAVPVESVAAAPPARQALADLVEVPGEMALKALGVH